MPAATLDQVVSLCKRRGFIYPGSAIYGGMANSWDYGPLGVELINNIKREWWEAMVYRRNDVEGIDCALIMNRKVWKYSGHEAAFNDPLLENRQTNKRFRLDQVIAHQSEAVRLDLCKRMGVTFGGDWNDTLTTLVGRLMADTARAAQELAAAKLVDPETGEAGEWGEPRQFNTMLSTIIGPVPNEENRAYLRPETAQGILVNFKHVMETMRRKPPFGVAQIGRSFRNEITPGNFIFRTREFDQMELEFFIPPPPYAEGEKTDDQWHQEWIQARFEWYLRLGISPDRLRLRAHTPDELAHYSKATTDVEYRYPGTLGFSEIEGIANRRDFDLSAHSREVPNDAETRVRLHLQPNPDSVENLTWFHQERNEHLVPWVIEPAAGVARPALAFLCEAFAIERVGEVPEAEAKAVLDLVASFVKSAHKNEHLPAAAKQTIAALGDAVLKAGIDGIHNVYALLEAEGASKIEIGKKLKGQTDRLVEAHFRTVLRLAPRLAPIKAAIFPLKRNDPKLVELAHAIKRQLHSALRVVYDDTGAIGKLYRRQDEIGTPFCITVDYESLSDGTVTVRERDSMEQTRVPIKGLRRDLMRRIAPERYDDDDA